MSNADDDLINSQSQPHQDKHELSQPGAIAHVSIAQFSGSLPHPDILRDYKNIVPGAADRIIAMAESQSSPCREQEKTNIAAQIADAASMRKDIRLGQILGFTIVTVAIAAGAAAIIFGEGLTASIAGGLIGGGGVVGLVSVFLFAQRESNIAQEFGGMGLFEDA